MLISHDRSVWVEARCAKHPRLTFHRWFSSVVVEGKPMDEDSSSSSSDNGDDGLAEPGQTWLVDKGTIKVLARGMEQYEELVEKRLRKRAKKEGWDLA